MSNDTTPTSDEIRHTFVEAVRIFMGELDETPTAMHIAALAAAADELAARMDPVYAARLDTMLRTSVGVDVLRGSTNSDGSVH